MTPEEAVTLKLYLESLVLEIRRRLDNVERHLEKVEERAPAFLTRDLYEERHEEIRRDIGRLVTHKADAEGARLLAARIEVVENSQRESQLLIGKRASDRRRLWTIAATFGAFSSAIVTLALHGTGAF